MSCIPSEVNELDRQLDIIKNAICDASEYMGLGELSSAQTMLYIALQMLDIIKEGEPNEC
jgi:hypothetical protein